MSAFIWSPPWRTMPQPTLWEVLTRDNGLTTRRPCGCFWDPGVFGHYPGNGLGCGRTP